MKSVKIFFMFFLVVVQAEAKFTKSDRERATLKGTTKATGIAGSAQAGATTTSTSYETLEQSSRDTVQNGQKGQAVATVMKVGLYAAGAYYASQCGPGSPSACVQAAVMFLMGSQAAKSAKSFNAPIANAWDNACTYSTLGCGNTPTNPYSASLTPGVINENKSDADAQNISDALSKGGYAVDLESGKIKTPKGNIGSDSSSLEASLGAEGLKGLMGQVSDIEKDAKSKVDQIKNATAALGFDGGGGNFAIGEGGYGDGLDGGVASKLDRLRKPAAQAKGLTKNFNGDPIGVASDSIFEMMSRRYNLKNSQKSFFGPDLQ